MPGHRAVGHKMPRDPTRAMGMKARMGKKRKGPMPMMPKRHKPGARVPLRGR